MSDVNILMLGTMGSGKTCFMHAMYDTMRTGFSTEGFTFVASSLDDDLDLTNNWTRMTNQSSGVRQWPNPSIDKQSYDFEFQYGYQRYMTFSWLDYRGGDIYTPDKTVRGDLQAKLNEADGVLVCMPCDQLVASSEGNSDSQKRAITASQAKQINVPEINRMFADLFKARANALPAVMLVFTKFDLLSNSIKASAGPNVTQSQINDRVYCRLLEIAKAMFSPLFAKGPRWSVLVCPVTLGYGLAVDSNSAKLEPVNVDIPVMFTFLSFATEISRLREQEMQQVGRDIDKKDANWISRRWNGAKIAELKARLEVLRSQQKEISGRIKTVEDAFPKDAIIFVNGDRSTIGAR